MLKYSRVRNKRRATFINFGIFSRGYVLIKGVTFNIVWIFLFLILFHFFFLWLYVKKNPIICYLRMGRLRLFKGLRLFLFDKFSMGYVYSNVIENIFWSTIIKMKLLKSHTVQKLWNSHGFVHCKLRNFKDHKCDSNRFWDCMNAIKPKVFLNSKLSTIFESTTIPDR